MKKKLLTILAFSGITALYAQVQQTPMIEHFTQASCTPCASQNPQLKTTLTNFGDANYVRVSHQTSWPGVDPMNSAFPSGPQARVGYYNFNGVPATSMNGGATGAPNTIVTSSSINNAASNMTPYDITATQSWASASEVTVNIDVINVTGIAISSADRIFVTMVENEVTYASAPGSNGETSFEFVMRQMYNASTGAANATTGSALGAIPAMSTTNFNFTITNLPSHLRDKNQVAFAVYIQNNSTKQMYQASKTELVNIPGIISVSAASTSVIGPEYCDYDITPSIEFTNNDSEVTVTEVIAEYAIDDGTPVQQTFTGSLSTGQSTDITFPASTLNGGTSVVSGQIVSVNGSQNWASPSAISIADETYNKLNTTGVDAPISEGMENAIFAPGSVFSRDLTTAFFDVVASIPENRFGILDGPSANVGAVGGFSNSNRSIYVSFYNIQSGTMNLVMHKANLGTGSQLSFSHAYRQYQAENDRLEVFVSTDCGNTWTSVFNKAGTALATLPPAAALYVPASAEDWATNPIDLSAYDSMDDVIIRFQATSAYGNNLFLDDIALNTTLSINDISAINAVKVYPNPTSDFIQISGLTTSKNYVIYNILGAKITQGNISENEMIDVKGFTSGMYFLKFDKGNTIKFLKE
jgi:hypothetical protein